MLKSDTIKNITLPDRKDKSFPSELKRIRTALGVNRKDFAKMAGSHEGCIRRYEEPGNFYSAVPRPPTYNRIVKAINSVARAKDFENKNAYKHAYKVDPVNPLFLGRVETFWHPVKPWPVLNQGAN